MMSSNTARRAVQPASAALEPALHDPLTGLPDRAGFRRCLEQEISGMRRDGSELAVLSLDLDGFKHVNALYGYRAGDELLASAGDRLQKALRGADTVARLAGDEFAIILADVAGPESAAAAAERIIAELSRPFTIAGRQVSIGASIGITIATPNRRPEQLMRSADLAMYRAKADGRSTFRFFEPGMDERVRERRELEEGLRAAVERNHFELEYQPLYSMPDESLRGFAALLRWNHPRRGSVSPDVFIPIAEEIGLTSAIGEWVLAEACSAAALWPASLRLAVDVPALRFKEQDGAQRIASIASAAGLAPERLEIDGARAGTSSLGHRPTPLSGVFRLIGNLYDREAGGRGLTAGALVELRSQAACGF